MNYYDQLTLVSSETSEVKMIHVIFKAGGDLIRLYIGVRHRHHCTCVITREEVIRLAERLVLHQGLTAILLILLTSRDPYGQGMTIRLLLAVG